MTTEPPITTSDQDLRDAKEALGRLNTAQRFGDADALGRIIEAYERVTAPWPVSDAEFKAFCASLGWDPIKAERMGMRAALEAAKAAR